MFQNSLPKITGNEERVEVQETIGKREEVLPPPFAVDTVHECITETVKGTKRIILRNGEKKMESPEDRETMRFFGRHLAENVKAAETLRKMQPIIQEFQARAPRVCKLQCGDGRVHGSKSKGYPPGTITSARTDGANIDISIGNTALWDRINGVVADALRSTPDKPAVFMAFGHRSDHQGLGCAAHNLDDAEALKAVTTQAQMLRTIYREQGFDRDALYVIAGMTNTDDMSETLYFEDGFALSSADIIRELSLQTPGDIFSPTSLQSPLDDSATRRHVQNLPIGELVSGTSAPMYRDLQTAVAMEAYLLREISAICDRHGEGADRIFNPDVFDAVYQRIKSVEGLPESLHGPLTYQILWNIAYTLYQRNDVASMNADERECHLDHNEELVCYGEGFETLPRNRCLLIKPGRGNDIDALTVAKNVLLKNRKHAAEKGKAQPHPPLVHINIEVPDPTIDSWQSFCRQVTARMMTMQQTIYATFGEDVRILSTYSYADGKEFFPLRVNPQDIRECCPADVLDGMTAADFSSSSLRLREFSYTQATMKNQSA